MIDYDTSDYPSGSLGWARLLEAIESASPSDESDWIEFKANLDLSKRTARPILAKAIVAFANRHVARAARHLNGRALVVIGLEPGNLVGAPTIDPAELNNAIQPYLADPAPGWDVQYLSYKGKQVLVVTVNAPQSGDPIHCIAKDGDKVRDGEVYVRHVGQSAPARSADLRMLSTRLLAQLGPGLEVEVFADAGAGLPLFDYPADWVSSWIDAERDRLMAPLAPPPPPPIDRRLRATGGLDAYGLSESLLSQASAASRMAGLVAKSNPFVTEHEEDRTPEEFAAEVDEYLDKCRQRIPKAVKTLRKELSPAALFKVRNLTDQNFRGLEVRVHVEGDVSGYRGSARFTSLAKYTRGAPRAWGPWTETKDFGFGPDYSHLIRAQNVSPAASTHMPRPGPDIVNGGSVDITFPPIDLRPHAEEDLHEVVIVAGGDVVADVTCTWSATAVNINGRVEGAFTIPLANGQIDLREYLWHGSTARPSDGPTGAVWMPDDLED